MNLLEKRISNIRKIKLDRAICQAKQNHPDYKEAHMDEVRDIQNNNTVKVKARLNKEIDKYTQRAIERREKRHGKN